MKAKLLFLLPLLALASCGSDNANSSNWIVLKENESIEIYYQISSSSYNQSVYRKSQYDYIAFRHTTKELSVELKKENTHTLNYYYGNYTFVYKTYA